MAFNWETWKSASGFQSRLVLHKILFFGFEVCLFISPHANQFNTRKRKKCSAIKTFPEGIVSSFGETN